VIRALGRNEELARGAIRFSFGKDNDDEDVDYAVAALSRAVESLRAISPLAPHVASGAMVPLPVGEG
jgi:cysteine desulfurase